MDNNQSEFDRLQQTETDADDMDLSEEASITGFPDGEGADDPLDQLRQQAEEAKDRALRAQAELDNFRKRMFRELEAERRYAGTPLLGDLLPVLDNFERAIDAAEQSQEANSLLDGIRLVAQQIEGVLAQHGCTRIEASAGDPFDHNIHEAASQMPSDEYEQGTVMMVLRVGYQLHDRVIRPAQVIVSSGSAESED
jgi:molecular chaperone GrpE